MPHKLKPAATAEQLCAAIHSLAATSSAAGSADPSIPASLLASVSSITPSSVSWLCSSLEMQPLVRRILAMAKTEPKRNQADPQPPAASADEEEMSAELSSLSSLCHSADLHLCSLQSSLAHLTAASHTLQQQLNDTQHTIQQHDTSLTQAQHQLTQLQHQHSTLAQAHTATLHTLTAQLTTLPAPPDLAALTAADAAVDAALQCWDAAAGAVWGGWAAGEAEMAEVEAELQRLSGALEVQYRERVHAELQRLAAQHRYEAIMRQGEHGSTAQYGPDDDEHHRAVVAARLELVSLQRRLHNQLSDELLHSYSCDRALLDTAPVVQQHNSNMSSRLRAQLQTAERAAEWQKQAAAEASDVNSGIQQHWKRQQLVKRHMQTSCDATLKEVEALKARLASYPDIRARHAFLNSSTVSSHQSTLTRLQQVLHTLQPNTTTQDSLHPPKPHPLRYSALHTQLTAYHTTHQTTHHTLQTQHTALTDQLATLDSHLAAGNAIAHREAAADGALSAVGCVHPSGLVRLLGDVSDAVDVVGERCNEVLAEEEQVRRMKQAAKNRRWNETAVMEAMLQRPELLGQAEAELRRRLGDGEGREWN